MKNRQSVNGIVFEMPMIIITSISVQFTNELKEHDDVPNIGSLLVRLEPVACKCWAQRSLKDFHNLFAWCLQCQSLWRGLIGYNSWFNPIVTLKAGLFRKNEEVDARRIISVSLPI